MAGTRRVVSDRRSWPLGLGQTPGFLTPWKDHRMLQLTDFIIDCPDTMKLASFYSEVTGRPVKADSDENWAGIQFGEIELAFNLVEDYRAPQWPDSEHPKQFHLDFEVDDIDAEQNRVLALGATMQQDSIGPNGYGFRVYTDPSATPSASAATRGSPGRTRPPSGPTATRALTSRGGRTQWSRSSYQVVGILS